jgi:predicted ABC-type ATPase
VSPDPVLHLLAGPNGSGKTTLARRVIVPAILLPAAHSLLEDRSSFITETVFSHPSKVELVQRAQEVGYRVYLHVVVLPEALSVRRVAHRVGQGGHAVPEKKIRERYRRLWPLVVQARALADMTYVYDNSTAAQPFRLMASYELGQVLGKPTWAAWTPIELP